MTMSITALTQEKEGEPIQLHGIVVDSYSQAPLPAAHIVLNGEKGMTPDPQGKFIIKAQKQDTILITHVGYRDYLIPIPALQEDKYFVRVNMDRAMIELEEVVIYRWPSTEAAFKEEILAMEVPPEEKILIPGSYQGPPRPMKNKITSPISFFYQKFSKAAKQERRFEATKARMEGRRMLDAKYHPELVKEVTGIEDPEEVEALMGFCEISDQFIEKANQYDLVAAINKCYSDYLLAQY